MTSRPFAPYYKYVRYHRSLPIALLFTLLSVPACNRGAHPAQVGKTAPDFNVSDGASRIHLADYRGHVVLLNFWASWCGPCISELPSLLDLHHDRPDLTILAVSIDEDADDYRRFLARRHVDLITVRDPAQKAAGLFHTDMWPETYAIDRNGVIRRKFVGATDWSNPEIRAYLTAL